MMSFSIEKYPNEPIIVTTLHADYVMTELEAAERETLVILATAREPHFLITVFDVKLDLGEIMRGTGSVARGEESLFHHPKVKGVIFVTQDKILKLTAEGMGAEAFGKLDVPAFTSLKEALTYARSH